MVGEGIGSSLQFLLAVVSLVMGGVCLKIGLGNVRGFFSTDDGRRIVKGIVMAGAFVLIFVVIGVVAGCAGGTYLNWASVYAGLEDTKQNSPMCSDREGDQTTSNIGLRGSFYESADKWFSANGKYTHHSCAFADDGESYDALGIELDYRFWER